MLDEVAARVGAGRRVVVFGHDLPDAVEALRACGCDVTTAAHPAADVDGAPFDVALVSAFREEWQHPAEALRRVRGALASDGRVLLSRAGAGPAAVRVAVYGESAGEAIAPLVRDVDVERYASRALAEMLASSGFRVVPGTADDAWIEGVVADDASRASAAREDVTPPSDVDRVARLESELAALREFVRSVLERQHRLHEELARLRAGITERDGRLASLRAALDEAFGASALASERKLRLEHAENRLAAAEARIADLEMRRLRLAEAVVELRERATP